MVMATADLGQQRSDLQFGPYVEWSESIVILSMPPVGEARRSKVVEVGVRAMYARLASDYEAEPTVPDHGGGVPGDRYPL